MTAQIRKCVYAALSLVFLVYAVRYWITTAGELRRFYMNMWIWDPWDYLSHFDRYKHFDLTVLWIQHNEHREIGTEIAYVMDIFLFHGRQLFPEAIGIAAYLGVWLLFISVAWTTAEDKRPIACGALLTMAVAGYKICAVSLATPFLTSWPQWEFFGAFALAAIAMHKRRRDKLLLIAAVISAVAATYSMSNGMLIWPLIFVAALLLRFDWKELATIALCGVLSIGLYFVQYKNLHTMSLDTALHNPGYLVEFLGSFLGMPFDAAQHLSNPSTTPVYGLVALGVAAVECAWIVGRKLWRAPAVIVMGGFCVLVLASSALTACGRMNPADPMIVAARAGRYITEPTLFWCALLLLGVWLIREAWNGYAAFVILAIAGFLAFTTLPRSIAYYEWWEAYFQRSQWAAIGFANGVTDNAISDVLFPGPQYVAQFKHVLIDNRLAMFAGPEPGWVGKQADQVFERGADAFIPGQVTSVRKIGKDYEVQGWLDGVKRAVFVDGTGRIIGFAMRPNAGPAELYTHDVPRALAFTGFIKGEFGARNFSLWAIDRRGRKMYRTGSLATSLPQ